MTYNITIKVAKFKGDIFNIRVNQDNYKIVINLLNNEKKQIVDKLKEYEASGLIGYINVPRNKSIQPELDELVRRKRIINKSIEQIIQIFK